MDITYTMKQSQGSSKIIAEIRLRKEFILNQRMYYHLGLFSPFYTYENAYIYSMDDLGFGVRYKGFMDFVLWTDYESY
jgi:hypothetical protein